MGRAEVRGRRSGEPNSRNSLCAQRAQRKRASGTLAVPCENGTATRTDTDGHGRHGRTSGGDGADRCAAGHWFGGERNSRWRAGQRSEVRGTEQPDVCAQRAQPQTAVRRRDAAVPCENRATRTDTDGHGHKWGDGAELRCAAGHWFGGERNSRWEEQRAEVGGQENLNSRTAF